MSRSLLVAFSLIILLGSVVWAEAKENTETKRQVLPDAQLLKAVEALDVHGVKAALQAGANPDCSSQKDQKTCSAIRLLILSTETRRDVRPDRSADAKCKEILNLLLSRGASLQYHDQDVLYHAVRKGLFEVTELLLEVGANPKLEVYYRKPIELAVERARDDIAQLLIKHGAKKVNARDSRQSRFIYLAGLNPRKDVPEYTHPILEMYRLLENGAEVNTANRGGQRALHNAFGFLPHYDNYSTIMFLLHSGANPNLLARERATEKFNTVFHRFVFYSGISIDTAKALKVRQPIMIISLYLDVLIKNGANTSLADSDGKTPLHIAVEYDNLVFARMLIEKNAVDVSVKDKDGKTPLDYAESGEMIKLLKSHGAKQQ